MLRSIIRDRQKSIKKGRSSDVAGRDLLTFMLEERFDSWSEDEVLGHLTNFLSAGHETSAGTMTWGIWAMVKQPHLQDKLRAVIMTLPEEYTVAEIDALPYIDNFIHETLRMYSPAIWTPREAIEDMTLAGIMLPKGTLLNLNPHIMNHHPDLWGPTHDVFDPERWETQKNDVYAFQSFSNGPRICIGKAFAYLELKCLLVALMRKFKWEDTGEAVIAESKFVYRPRGGIRVRVSRLNE